MHKKFKLILSSSNSNTWHHFLESRPTKSCFNRDSYHMKKGWSKSKHPKSKKWVFGQIFCRMSSVLYSIYNVVLYGFCKNKSVFVLLSIDVDNDLEAYMSKGVCFFVTVSLLIGCSECDQLMRYAVCSMYEWSQWWICVLAREPSCTWLYSDL